MQEDLMPEFKAFFGQHCDAVGEVRGIHRLAGLAEKLFERFGFFLVCLDAVAESSISSVGDPYNKVVIHISIPFSFMH